MRILILGAGAIGSLFGALLSRYNDVTLVGRREHINRIKKNGLRIMGKTKITIRPKAISSISELNTKPELLILSVKSYDTESAIREALPILDKKTILVSIQNGLDNIDLITSHIDKDIVVGATTTEAAYFVKPGVVEHTGFGKTIIGELNNLTTERIKRIESILNESGIKTEITTDIQREIWMKGIINSCINPITAIFNIKNGQILGDPLLVEITKKICNESTKIANANGINNIDEEDVIKKTIEVIERTSTNYSSMVQSLMKKKKTEIESINGYILKTGRKYGITSPLNELMSKLIKIRESMEDVR